MTTATLTSLPTLRVATFDDHAAISELEAANALAGTKRDDWLDLWRTNPLWPRLEQDWPIGWVLENSDGRLVGSLLNIPSLYKFRGADLICANGRGWVVDREYRGFALSLMGEYFSQTNVDLFVNTTVGLVAVPVIQMLSDRIPRGDFETVAFFSPLRTRWSRKFSANCTFHWRTCAPIRLPPCSGCEIYFGSRRSPWGPTTSRSSSPTISTAASTCSGKSWSGRITIPCWRHATAKRWPGTSPRRCAAKTSGS